MSFVKFSGENLFTITNKIHRHLFGHGLPGGMTGFISNLSWSLIGGIVSGLILLATNILAGRFLGPTEYGKINIIGAIGQVITVFVLFGMDRVSMRGIAMQKTREQKAKHISTTLYFVVFTSIIVAILYLLINHYLATLLGLSTSLLIVGLVYGLVLSFRQLTENFIRGLERFRYQSLSRILESFAALGIFLFLWTFLSVRNYATYIVALMISGGVLVFLYIANIRSYLTRFSKHIFFEQFSFGSLFFVASVLGILFSSLDKFLVGRYMNLHQLGIYSAYFSASTILLSQVASLFGNVFFPTVAKHLDSISLIVRKVDKLFLIVFFPLWSVSVGSIFIIIRLFGSSYGFNWLYAASFGLLAVLMLIFSVNAAIVQAYSRQAFQRVFYLGNFTNLGFIGLYGIIIHYIGLSIPWVVAIVISSYVMQIVFCKYALYREKVYQK